MKRWILLAAVLSGCATTNDNPQDPFEPFNRGVYRFNDAVDKAVIKPVAQGYDKVVPQPVQTGVANFFSNLGDVIVVINDFMQLKVAQGVSDAGRFMINSTIGILGFIDVGSDIGLPKHNEDFGQTMGYWGMDTGPYIVLPLFGPSDARDTAGLVVDIVTYPVYYVNDSAVRAALYGTGTVSARDQLLQSERVLDTAALDQYQFLRDAYLQRRRNLVHDGNPPKEDFEGVEDEGVEDEGVEDENVEDEGVEGKHAPMPDSATTTVEQKSAVVSRNFVVFSQGSEGRPPRVWLPRIPRSVAE